MVRSIIGCGVTFLFLCNKRNVSLIDGFIDYAMCGEILSKVSRMFSLTELQLFLKNSIYSETVRFQILCYFQRISKESEFSFHGTPNTTVF